MGFWLTLLIGATIWSVWRLNRLTAQLRRMRAELEATQTSLALATSRLDRLEREPAPAPPPAAEPPPPPTPEAEPESETESEPARVVARPVESRPSLEVTEPVPEEPPREESETASAMPPPAAPESPAEPATVGEEVRSPLPVTPDESPFGDAVAELWQKVRHYATSGNPVAKIGVVILFFGIAFLLRFAAERGAFPIQLRLAGAAAVGLALLAIGWRQRERHGAYGLTLQGGGIGVLYLTVFVAARVYSVVELGLALAAMIFIVAFGSAIAVLQRSQALAVLSVLGGFLAPVLTSSGDDRHVALFTYFLILDLGIFAIAWFRSWRILNWVGFLFTFALFGAWAALSYESEKFSTSEPFLVAFFVLYVTIGALFALRQPPKLVGLVDGSLVFGAPVAALAIQAELVRHTDFGLAFSAVGAGAVYIAFATWFWRLGERLRFLAESYLALAVGFATLAIPFALDDHNWTAAAWAAEGAGIFWVGLRQRRLLVRIAGIGLQLVAGMVFVATVADSDGTMWLQWQPSVLLGAILLGVAGLVTSYLLWRERDSGVLSSDEAGRAASLSALGWGQLWLLAGVSVQGAHLTPSSWLDSIALLVPLSVLFVVERVVAHVLGWSQLERTTRLVSVAGALVLMWSFPGFRTSLFEDGALIVWLVWAAAHWLLLRSPRDASEEGPEVRIAHALGYSVHVLIATWAAAQWLEGQARGNPDLSDVWGFGLYGVAPAAALLLGNWLCRRVAFFVGLASSYVGWGSLALHLVMAGWLVASLWEAGSPEPLPFVPLLNPIELGQAFVLLTWLWLARQRVGTGAQRPLLAAPAVRSVLATFGFLGLTFALLRAFYHWGGVPYDVESQWGDASVQSGLTVLWTVLALGAMVLATRRSSRRLWIAGAALLGVVVLKLFLVDLEGTGTVARIVSFLTVGGLMLLIGYFSPLPPRSAEPEERAESGGADEPGPEEPGPDEDGPAGATP